MVLTIEVVPTPAVLLWGWKSIFNKLPSRYPEYVPKPGIGLDEPGLVINCGYSTISTFVPSLRTLSSSNSNSPPASIFSVSAVSDTKTFAAR